MAKRIEVERMAPEPGKMVPFRLSKESAPEDFITYRIVDGELSILLGRTDNDDFRLWIATFARGAWASVQVMDGVVQEGAEEAAESDGEEAETADG